MTQKTPPREDGTSFLPVLIACAGSILIGVSPIFVRSSTLGPMTVGFYRMLFALPLLWIWMQWEKHHVDKQVLVKKDYFILALAGGFFAVDLALWNFSVNHTTIVNAILFNNTAAFFVPLWMWLVFSEKQSVRFIVAAICGFLGCVLLAGESFTISIDYFIGDIISITSGFMVASYIIAIKKIRERLATGVLMFWTGIASLIGLGGLGVLFGESFWPLTRYDWFSVLGQAILVHVMGQGLLAYAMGKITASYGALILLLSPVTAAILGWIFYGEALSVIKFVGMSVIMISIIAVQEKQKKLAVP
ncbi:MAG: DMT family transporter [Alphaproteobacteria bacterium]